MSRTGRRSPPLSVKRAVAEIQPLLEKLHVDRWDYVIVGDGSGSNWANGCGWGSISIDSLTLTPQFWYGSMNRGTVNLGEMLAYLQPLTWILSEEARRRSAGQLVRLCEIHIITDSAYCRTQGESKDLCPAKNGALWQLFADFRRQGLNLHWHWEPRELLGLNRYADRISRAMREMVDATAIQTMMGAEGRRSRPPVE